MLDGKIKSCAKGARSHSTMDNFITGLVTAARADVETCLADYLAELDQQNLFIEIGQFSGLFTTRKVVLY